MCEEYGCIKKVWELMPGDSLNGMKYGDILIYDGVKRMIVEPFRDFAVYVTKRGEKHEVLLQTLLNFDERTGRFEDETTWDTDLYKHYPKPIHTLDADMREIGL